MEFAGEVSEISPRVQMGKPGQRVFGLAGGGAQARYIVTDERLLAEVPENLSWAEAAAVPEAFITAHDAMWIQAGLRPAGRGVIHSGGSGGGAGGGGRGGAGAALPHRGPPRAAQRAPAEKEEVGTSG